MKEGKHVILCVDDEPEILKFLEAVLAPKCMVNQRERTFGEGFDIRGEGYDLCR